MLYSPKHLLFNSCILFTFAIANAQPISKKIDLGELFKKNKLTTYNRVASLSQQGSRTAIVLNEDVEERLVLIPEINFTTGVIEIDLKGQNVFQHSFIGIAFHMLDSDNFDAIYFRPFQFLNPDSVLHARSLQYVSFPEFTWQKLREEKPGKFESPVKPIPDPDEWFHVRIVIKEKLAEIFVNDSSVPSLSVEILNKRKSGKLALYTADRSGGSFANLTIISDK